MCFGYWMIPADDEVIPLIEEWYKADKELFEVSK